MANKKFENRRQQEKLKNIHLSSLSVSSLEDALDDLTIRCKFNFSYFDFTQGTTFFNLTRKQQEDLINALIHFSRNSLSYWKESKGGKQRFVPYEKGFPLKTKFKKPKYIPTDVLWCRFRLAWEFRLIGFTVPEQLHNTNHKGTGEYFDKNTFYVVFIDPKHEFSR